MKLPMKIATMAVPVLAGVMLCSAAVAQNYSGNPGPGGYGYTQGRGYNQGPPPPPQGPGYNQGPPQGPGGWDAPPPEFRDVQRNGYRDGIYGAQQDVKNGRRTDPNNRDEYRKPAVPRRDMNAYRDAFRRGYFAAMAHMRGGPRPY